MKKKIIFSSMVVSATLSLSGCGFTDYAEKKVGEKIVEKSIESQTGADVDVNTDNGQVNIKSDKGDFSMSGEGTATLSAEFPKDIFIAPDAKILFSMASAKEKNYSVAYITEISVDEIFTKYKNELEKNGWADDQQTELSFDNSKTITYKKGTARLSVIVGKSEDEKYAGKTSVQINGSEEVSNDLPDVSEPDMDKEV